MYLARHGSMLIISYLVERMVAKPFVVPMVWPWWSFWGCHPIQRNLIVVPKSKASGVPVCLLLQTCPESIKMKILHGFKHLHSQVELVWQRGFSEALLQMVT